MTGGGRTPSLTASYLLILIDVLVLAVGVLALPYVRTDAVEPPVRPVSAADAVAHIERVWERASREPGPPRLVRVPGVEVRDDCFIGLPGPGPDIIDDGTRRVTWQSEPGGDAAQLLRQVETALLGSGHEVFPGYPDDGVQVLSGAGAYRWILRMEAGRAVVTGETPCLRVVLPDRFGPVRDDGDVQSLLIALRDEDTLGQPLEVTQYLRFIGIENAAQQQTAAVEAAAAGWTVLVGQTVDGGFFDFGGDLVVMARRTVLLTPESVVADREYFEELCGRTGCRYEGWDTSGRGYELR